VGVDICYIQVKFFCGRDWVYIFVEIAKILLKLRKIGLTQVVERCHLLADHSKMLLIVP
jgi:hypothetical protein